MPEQKIEERLLFLLQEKVLFKEGDLLWVYLFYYGEAHIAREIHRLLDHPCLLRSVDISKALDWAQQQLRLQLAKEQAEAVALGIQKK